MLRSYKTFLLHHHDDKKVKTVVLLCAYISIYHIITRAFTYILLESECHQSKRLEANPNPYSYERRFAALAIVRRRLFTVLFVP